MHYFPYESLMLFHYYAKEDGGGGNEAVFSTATLKTMSQTQSSRKKYALILGTTVSHEQPLVSVCKNVYNFVVPNCEHAFGNSHSKRPKLLDNYLYESLLLN